MKFKLVEDTGELSNEYDSEGNQLTKSQAEFFKNSKVRDSKGRLLVCYHGTTNDYFTIFDAKKLDNSTRKSQIGQGFYFTNSLSGAKEYMKKEDVITGRLLPSKTNHLFSVYLNITNPFYIEHSKKLNPKALFNLIMDGDNEWFFTEWIPFSVANREVNDHTYTREEIEKFKKEDKVKLWLDWNYFSREYGEDKDILSETVRAYHNQELLLKNYQKYFNCDGFIELGRVNQIVAFKPNQIKSITNKEPSNSDNINEDLWSKKVYKGTRWNGEPYEDTQEIYTPKKDSKYQRLLRKPINQLTYEEIKYIYVVHVCWYMQQIWQFNTIKDAYDRIIDSDIEKSLKECYEFVHNLSFPLTIYRAIRESEFKDGVFNISGKKSSLSWSTNLEIYKNERSIFKNAGNIVSCNIDSNIVDNANTINNFIHYTASDKTKQHYGEYEITLKDNFKTSDLHDLHWVDKDGNGYYNKFKL